MEYWVSLGIQEEILTHHSITPVLMLLWLTQPSLALTLPYIASHLSKFPQGDLRMKRTAALIFDCDGVMFDSRQANINFYNHLLTHFGLAPLSEDQIAFVHMHTADESVRHIFEGTPYTEQALAYRWDMDYTPFLEDMVIEPGLKELLQRLKPRLGLAVATNRSNTIGKVLEANRLDGYFDIVVSSLDVKHPKPHPECLFKVLDFLRVPAARSFYVGDSLIDWETAGAAGVPFISYKDRALQADYHADRMKGIEDILKESGLLEEA
jgi:phosphoglycolate phosphatase